VNDGGHLWCAWTREEAGGCVCRSNGGRARTLASKHSAPKPTKR
jgi:hypothetical protein